MANEPEHRSVAATLAKEVPDEEIAGIRDISFAVVMRGYDRSEVDAYVTRVNRIIAELQVSRSPRSAIRHALDQVSEETRGLLERAHETADQITARSRAQADDRVQRADAEARQMIATAEARVRELEADADSVSQERQRLIDEVRGVSKELAALASVASARYGDDEEPPESDAETATLEAQPAMEGEPPPPAEGEPPPPAEREPPPDAGH